MKLVYKPLLIPTLQVIVYEAMDPSPPQVRCMVSLSELQHLQIIMTER